MILFFENFNRNEPPVVIRILNYSNVANRRISKECLKVQLKGISMKLYDMFCYVALFAPNLSNLCIIMSIWWCIFSSCCAITWFIFCKLLSNLTRWFSTEFFLCSSLSMTSFLSKTFLACCKICRSIRRNAFEKEK